MIEIKELKKSYFTGENETAVLHGVDFKVKQGEFVAIMGPSGSGKSTIMNILGLLDKPTTGEYILDRTNVSNLSDDEQATFRAEKIGFVFQSFNLLPRTTVIRNVMLPLIYNHKKELTEEKRLQKVYKALESVDFPKERYNNLSNNLSGGQIQRVAIARALVNDPSIILADEPTGNLDSKTSDTVLKTFQELNKKLGCTIVLITHEADVAGYADRTIHVKDGLIVEDNKN